jgi:hypothetical protein
MRITIESTSEIVTLAKRDGRHEISIPARVWEGETESGIKVHCLVTRIAARDGQNLAQFESELREVKPPSVDALDCFPLRLIL